MTVAPSSKQQRGELEGSGASEGFPQLPLQFELVTSRLFSWVRKPKFYLLFRGFLSYTATGAEEKMVVKKYLLYPPCKKGPFCSSPTNFSGFPTHQALSHHRAFVQAVPLAWDTFPSPLHSSQYSISQLSCFFLQVPLVPQIISDDSVIYPTSTMQFSFMVLTMLMIIS